MSAVFHRKAAWRTAGWILTTAWIGVTVSMIGCSRSFYREQADDDARRLVLEKSQDPRWDLQDFSIEMDPRSRYYDPYDPDYPPMPPDDPTSHEFMHYVDGKRGYAHWHDQYGTLSELENPGWEQYLDEFGELTDDGQIRIDLQDAVRLAYLHSPDWQEQLETLYLSALDVSTERFRFDVQFLQSFSGSDLGFTSLGSELGRRPLTGATGSTDTLSLDTDLRLRRQFATAGELVVGFANSIVWQFAGEDSTATASLLNFSLVQPLLRAGGRAIALETLTISERGLLSNVRALERWRKGFFTDIAIGDDGVSDLQRRGGFFGGTGLTGFSGQGAGGFGGVGQITGFGRGGFGGGAGGAGAGGGGIGVGGGAGVVGGFIGLLQQLQQLRNQENNLDLQLRTLALLEANQQAGLIGLDQVLQFQQSIETERANLLQARNGLQNEIDNYLRSTLGLPPYLPIALDDTFIEPFQFIDPDLSGLQNDISQLIQDFGEIEQPTVDDMQQVFEQVDTFHERMAEQFQVVQQDLQQMERVSEKREERMSPEEREQFRQTKEELRQLINELQGRFEMIQGRLQQLKAGLNPETIPQSVNELVVLNTDMSNLVGELSLVQVRARLHSVVLDPVRLSSEEALEIARTHRLDWMNNRAALVDTWRLIEFNANDLKSNLDIELSGELNTVGDNPMKFRDDQGRLTAALRFDAPFTRLLERNNFRSQLINYQQARRQLIQFEDRISQTLRQTLRNLEQLEVNLEIQRRAVTIAARRVDQARLELSRPIPPPEPGQPPQQFGPTAARDLVDAIEALRDAQNAFMSVWLNYYAGRLVLMRDLGLMRINEQGMWIEETIEEALRARSEESPLPPPVPEGWLRVLDPLPEDSGTSGAAGTAELEAPHAPTGPKHVPAAPAPNRKAEPPVEAPGNASEPSGPAEPARLKLLPVSGLGDWQSAGNRPW